MRQVSFIFYKPFSLFNFSENDSSLFSLPHVLISGFGYEYSGGTSSSPAEVSGVPAAVGRPVQRRHRAGTLNFFFLFFCLIYSTPSSYSISTIKNFKGRVDSPKSTFYIKKTTFWWDCDCSIRACLVMRWIEPLMRSFCSVQTRICFWTCDPLCYWLSA